MNPLLTIGVALTWGLAALLFASVGGHLLTVSLVVLAATQSVGLVLIAAGRRQLGAWLVLWPAFLVVPTGLVAAFGARRVLDEQAMDRFRETRVA